MEIFFKQKEGTCKQQIEERLEVALLRETTSTKEEKVRDQPQSPRQISIPKQKAEL